MSEGLANLIDVTVEQALCGAIIIQGAQAQKVRMIVSESDFSDRSLGRLYSTLVDMVDAGHTTRDVTALSARLKECKLFSDLGGAHGIGRICKECGSPASAVTYARRVAKLSGLRKLLQIATRIHQDCQRIDADPDSIALGAQAQMQETVTTDDNEFGDVFTDCLSVYEKVEKVRSGSGEKKTENIPTGLLSIDSLCSGLFRRDFNVIAARPSVGKTALAVQLGLNAAQLGYKVLFVSLEMTRDLIATRLLAGQLGVENRELRAGAISDETFDRLQKEVYSWEHVPFKTWKPRRRVTSERIASVCRVLKATTGIDMLIVDYFQLLRGDRRDGQRLEQLEAAAADLKEVVNELDMASIILAQLNRGAEGEKPKLSDIKGCGALEEAADGVWLLHRDRDAQHTKVILAKQRNSAVTEVRLGFDPGASRYFDEESSA